MEMELKSVLACPTCLSALEVKSYVSQNETLIEGILCCDDCSIVIPVSHGFPLFSEARTDNGNIEQKWLKKQTLSWFSQEGYEDFLHLKSERQLFDSYAFFQPFNESSRALLAVVKPLREQLSKGDIILDTWSRTGWMGEWLASLFPEQEIISIWEGNSNVLGYKGFAHWLPESERSKNLSIIFTHPDNPLPLATNSIQLTIGLDSLHRYSQNSFLAECRRVTKDEGVLFFPHIHLTNSEPEPFFERGCHQIHGKEWRALLEVLYSDSTHTGFVFSENKLFDCGDNFIIEDDCNTAHYNGAVLIAPKTWNGRKVKTEHNRPIRNMDRLILNPILNIDLTQSQISLASQTEQVVVSELLARHPIYQKRVNKVLGNELSDLECKIIFYADKALTIENIASILDLSVEQVCLAADRLYQREVLFPAAVSMPMALLQNYYGNLRYRKSSCANFSKLWQELGHRYQARPIIETEDGIEYDWDSTSKLVEATANWLTTTTLPSDRVLICTETCPELLIVVWACWLSDRVPAPVDASLPSTVIQEIIDRISPEIIFSTQSLSSPHFSFDSLASDDSHSPLFSDQIEPYIDREFSTPINSDPQSGALLLFTSGSTGHPKAVLLNQIGLLHSAQELVQHFSWKPGNRLLSLGPAHTMSGLRNPALAALISGSSIIIPDAKIMHAGRLFHLLKEQQVSHLATVPALLQQLMASKNRLLDESIPTHLQQIICTGQSIPEPVRYQVSDWLKSPIYSYYGLTETGGICLADILDVNQQGNLGFPSGAISQIVDSENNVLQKGEHGQLRIYSPANMLSYWEPSTISSVELHDGWIYTGDTVELMNDGSLNYIGRTDDQVKNHFGEVVYLQQVESAVSLISEIQDNCCIGLKDQESLAEKIILFLVTQGDTSPHLQNQVYAEIDSVLGPKKRPDDIVFIPEIQRLSNGKVNRSAIKLLYMDNLK